MNDDFLLDEEEDLDGTYIDAVEEEDEEDQESGKSVSIDDATDEDIAERKSGGGMDSSKYEGLMTKTELGFVLGYDDIVKLGKDGKNEHALEDAATILVSANPKHTSVSTVGYKIKELFHKQGHSRMVNTLYTPDFPLSSEDVDVDYKGEDDSGFNKDYGLAAREQISRFIEFLASRDLSKDSVISKRRKQRNIPAFIILLFSSGLYDLILECPTMPKVYQIQITQALQRIMKSKFDVVEALATKYEEMGRDIVAERVRKMQLSWFTKEPAEIRTTAEYSDLGLTYDDVAVYREYRSRFTNMSRAITQDIISDLIEVVIDEDTGIYEKLKDKTRSDAISDVKQIYQDWAKSNPSDSELATRVIYKDRL